MPLEKNYVPVQYIGWNQFCREFGRQTPGLAGEIKGWFECHVEERSLDLSGTTLLPSTNERMTALRALGLLNGNFPNGGNENVDFLISCIAIGAPVSRARVGSFVKQYYLDKAMGDMMKGVPALIERGALSKSEELTHISVSGATPMIGVYEGYPGLITTLSGLAEISDKLKATKNF